MRYILIGFILFTHSLVAQNVTIKGNAKSYSNDWLILYKYHDFITLTEKELGRCKVQENGDFELKLQIPEPQLSLMHFNVFKGYLLIEPNSEYTITLPLKQNKKPDDEINPFFNEKAFYFKPINKPDTELNLLISRFDSLYNHAIIKRFRISYGKYSKLKVDSAINEIETKLPVVDNKYFNQYKQYKYSSLRFMAYYRNRDVVIKNFFGSSPVLYENIAYGEMFNQAFKDFFIYLSEQRECNNVIELIFQSKNYLKLVESVKKYKYLTTDSLREMVILKALYDINFSSGSPKLEVVQILDSMIVKTQIKQHAEIAKSIKNQITGLMENFPAPPFTIVDLDSNSVNLDKFRGKFVYLNFCNLNSFTCLQDLDLLAGLRKKRMEGFEIVTILVGNSIPEMKKFVKLHDYSWPFLFFNRNNELLRNYKVKVYPTYYLINPEGILLMSPAPTPRENIEKSYFKYLMAWKNDQTRKKYQQNKELKNK